jgi:hypothetical protein
MGVSSETCNAQKRREEVMAPSTSKTTFTKSKTAEENDLEDILPGERPESQHFPPGEPANSYVLAADSVKGSSQDSAVHHRIAQRAFLLYEESGFRHGNDLEHWLEAERQVRTLGV